MKQPAINAGKEEIGINKGPSQKPCGPGYMWSPTNNRCVTAKASR